MNTIIKYIQNIYSIIFKNKNLIKNKLYNTKKLINSNLKSKCLNHRQAILKKSIIKNLIINLISKLLKKIQEQINFNKILMQTFCNHKKIKRQNVVDE